MQMEWQTVMNLIRLSVLHIRKQGWGGGGRENSPQYDTANSPFYQDLCRAPSKKG